MEKSTVPVYTNEWVRRTVERNGVAEAPCSTSCPTRSFCGKGLPLKTFCIRTASSWGRTARAPQACCRPSTSRLTDGSYYKTDDAIAGRLDETTPPPLLLTSTKSAEIIKHASNAFLAMKISFINAVANLCEAADANVEQVATGIGLDSRIGPKFLRPGIGYGGSCFPKDVAAFRSVADSAGRGLLPSDRGRKDQCEQKRRFLRKVRAALWTLRGKRLAVLGLAFKGETDDMRECPAIDLIEDAAGGRLLDLRVRPGGDGAQPQS